MDDECSMLSSCYWDAVSIKSDSTARTEQYHTPTGSLMDIPDSLLDANSSGSLTPTFHDMTIHDSNHPEKAEFEQSIHENIEPECVAQLNTEVQAAASIEQQNSINEITTEAAKEPLLSPPPPKKKNWKRDFWKRLSFTRSRFMHSFSIHKCTDESQPSKSIFRNLRNSLRRMRSFDKVSKLGKSGEKTPSKSASVVLGSDCDYFNFEKELTTPEAGDKDDIRNEAFTECYESTPIKPRRQFTQETYLTGSEEILKKAFNSLKRKSHLQDNKSLFDLSSTVSYIFTEDPYVKPLSADDPIFSKFIDSCVNAFLEVHQKQIDNSLQLINKTIGEHIDLFSEDLDPIGKSKKYQITELYGSKGVCVITNVFNKKQFIALKQNCPKSWIFFTSFLQHTDKSGNILPDQQWICFPALSITNLYIEKNFFHSVHREFKVILDALMQLIVILYCQRMNNFDLKINPFNVMLISSDLSIIFILIDSVDDDKGAVIGSGDWLNVGDSDVKDVRLAYQESLQKLNRCVEKFLSLPGNMCHLITASYPLDYLFFLLLKLNKDSGLLNDM